MSLLLKATLDSQEPDDQQRVFLNRSAVQLWLTIAIAILLMFFAAPFFGESSGEETGSILAYPPIPTAQRMALMQIARDTWRFYAADVDPHTHLPMDNFGANGVGAYTSASNIGVYLWAVVAANDLGLISSDRASSLIRATLT